MKINKSAYDLLQNQGELQEAATESIELSTDGQTEEIHQLMQIIVELGMANNIVQLVLDADYEGPGFHEVPPAIAALQSLTHLSLNDQPIPQVREEICQLTKLEALELANTGVNQLPASIIQLQQLKILDLFYNQFKKFPAEILLLTALEKLSFGSNYLVELPNDINHLTGLKDLDISSNKISILPNSLWQLTRLTSLKLAENPLAKIANTSDCLAILVNTKDSRYEPLKIAPIMAMQLEKPLKERMFSGDALKVVEPQANQLIKLFEIIKVLCFLNFRAKKLIFTPELIANVIQRALNQEKIDDKQEMTLMDKQNFISKFVGAFFSEEGRQFSQRNVTVSRHYHRFTEKEVTLLQLADVHDRVMSSISN